MLGNGGLRLERECVGATLAIGFERRGARIPTYVGAYVLKTVRGACMIS